MGVSKKSKNEDRAYGKDRRLGRYTILDSDFWNFIGGHSGNKEKQGIEL